jgi:hypothetical protein
VQFRGELGYLEVLLSRGDLSSDDISKLLTAYVALRMKSQDIVGEHEDEEQEGTAPCSGFSECPWVSVVFADLGVWIFLWGSDLLSAWCFGN